MVGFEECCLVFVAFSIVFPGRIVLVTSYVCVASCRSDKIAQNLNAAQMSFITHVQPEQLYFLKF